MNTEKKQNFKRTRYACYFAYLAMASVFCLPSMLFITFKSMYGISYTLLGTLVVVNFCTQLTIDLVFTFFTRFFNIKKAIRLMPLLTALGLIIYASAPIVFPSCIYLGLVIGTIIFSVAAGLCEVLLSPVVAALPSDNPEKDMSTLHSLYAYGVLTVVLISSIYFKIFGTQNWQYLAIFWAVLPIVSCVLFCISPMPKMNITHGDEKKSSDKKKYNTLVFCALCIFLGSCAENAMTNWISSYMEKVLSLPKTIGDISGLALFAILLGLTRTWYAKFGKNILRVLLAGMTGAAVCYVIAGTSTNMVVCLIACVLIGIFSAMLWPGTLILMDNLVDNPGVAAFALMAAAGDLGASIAPQLVGLIADKVAITGYAGKLALEISMTTEQIGMRTGILVSALFPVVGAIIVIYIWKKYKNFSARS